MDVRTIPKAAAGAGRRPGLAGWMLAAPMFLWLLVFVIAPTVILFVYSFCQRDELGELVFTFSLENYARVFDPTYLYIFWRSIWYAALTTAICIALGYPVAYFIGRAREDNRNRLLMLVMVPFWTSFLIRTYAWITILKSEGLLNGALQLVGVITAPLDILYTPFAVVIGLVYAYVPFMILPIYGSVEKLDNALIEAAFDLGAGPIRAFSKVIIPLTNPGIVAGHAARVYSVDRHVRDHRPDGRRAGENDRQRDSGSIYRAGARLALWRGARDHAPASCSRSRSGSRPANRPTCRWGSSPRERVFAPGWNGRLEITLWQTQ